MIILTFYAQNKVKRNSFSFLLRLLNFLKINKLAHTSKYFCLD